MSLSATYYSRSSTRDADSVKAIQGQDSIRLFLFFTVVVLFGWFWFCFVLLFICTILKERWAVATDPLPAVGQ